MASVDSALGNVCKEQGQSWGGRLWERLPLHFTRRDTSAVGGSEGKLPENRAGRGWWEDCRDPRPRAGVVATGSRRRGHAGRGGPAAAGDGGLGATKGHQGGRGLRASAGQGRRSPGRARPRAVPAARRRRPGRRRAGPRRARPAPRARSRRQRGRRLQRWPAGRAGWDARLPRGPRARLPRHPERPAAARASLQALT